MHLCHKEALRQAGGGRGGCWGGGGRPPPPSSPPPLPPHFHPNLTDQNTPCHCSSITAIVLQGVAASISTLQGGKICTPTVKAASLASILQAVVTSGMEF